MKRLLKALGNILFSLFVGSPPKEHHMEMRRKINDPTYTKYM